MIKDKLNNIVKPYIGNYHPINIYKGTDKIAGYTNTTSTGTNNITLQRTYNDKLSGEINGNSTQEIRTGINLFNEVIFTNYSGAYGITTNRNRIVDNTIPTKAFTRWNITNIPSGYTSRRSVY